MIGSHPSNSSYPISPLRADAVSPTTSTNSNTTFTALGQPHMETEVELARLAALDALEGKSSPESNTVEIPEPVKIDEKAGSSVDPSMSPAR